MAHHILVTISVPCLLKGTLGSKIQKGLVDESQLNHNYTWKSLQNQIGDDDRVFKLKGIKVTHWRH